MFVIAPDTLRALMAEKLLETVFAFGKSQNFATERQSLSNFLIYSQKASSCLTLVDLKVDR